MPPCHPATRHLNAALRSPPTAAAAAAVPDSQSAVAAWQLLEDATGGGKLPSPSRQASALHMLPSTIVEFCVWLPCLAMHALPLQLR